MLHIIALAANSVVSLLVVSPPTTSFVPEEYTKTTVWNPSTDHKSVIIQPGVTESFAANDWCKDDAATVPGTGSLPTTGSGAPSLTWTGWFVSLFDTYTLCHKKNYGSTALTFYYDFNSCEGFQKFVGNSTGNVYKRNGYQWDFTGVFDAE